MKCMWCGEIKESTEDRLEFDDNEFYHAEVCWECWKDK
jgi:hypothetical protein